MENKEFKLPDPERWAALFGETELVPIEGPVSEEYARWLRQEINTREENIKKTNVATPSATRIAQRQMLEKRKGKGR